MIKDMNTEKIHIRQKDTLTADCLNMAFEDTVRVGDEDGIFQNKTAVAIIASDREEAATRLLMEWCVYHKYLFRIYTEIPDEKDITDCRIVLFGNIQLTAKDSDTLLTLSEGEKTMLFTKLPDYQELNSSKALADFFGIAELIEPKASADGFRIFPGFMTGEGRIYREGDFYGSKDDTSVHIPYYKLSAGYEVYAVGLFDNQTALGIENKDLPPLLWRTKTNRSFIFAVNSDIFQGMPMLGVLTGFMVQESECYLYPIVNAQTISITGYPYLSNENEAAITQIYSRNSEALARDILWPNMVQVLRNYGTSFNFFAASQLDYRDEIGPRQDYLDFYLREIHKLPGEVGLSLNQVSAVDLNEIIDQNALFFGEHLPNYPFTALYTGDFSNNEIRGKLDNRLLDRISLVMSDYEEGDQILGFLTEEVLSVKFNLDGFQHETLDDLRMLAVQNSLGMSNMKVDVQQVIFPQDSTEEWHNLSLSWSRGKTYYTEYSGFDMVSMAELEKRVRRFLALDFTYEYHPTGIDIRIGNFDEEAYFILNCYDKSIDFVTHGEASRISANTYLIKAIDSNVKIGLKEDNLLHKPKNNTILPSNPEFSLPEEEEP